MWFSQRELSNGRLPWSTDLLNFPDGGILLLPDPLAAVFSLVGVPALGVAGAYTALVLLRLAMAGVIAEGLLSGPDSEQTILDEFTDLGLDDRFSRARELVLPGPFWDGCC
jgi:hypothetical protein